MPTISLTPRNAENALPATIPIAIWLLLVLVTLAPFLQAQTFTVLHDFTGGDDGGSPFSGLTRGPQCFYGTALWGGYRGSDCDDAGCGTVFQLSQTASGWDYSVLHTFMGGSDGAGPRARVVFGPGATLFGTTSAGGGPNCNVNGDLGYGNLGCGTVFRLVPPNQVGPTAGHHRNQTPSLPVTVIHTFQGGDGALPGFGGLVFDLAGNMYGTTAWGGWNDQGAVYEISPAGQAWTERVLYGFNYGAGGGNPYAGVVRDGSGNLYGGTTMGGGPNCGSCGVIFQLVPSAGGWTETTIFTFHANPDMGATPVGGLIADNFGNLYGSTNVEGSGNGGTVFVMQPQQNGWSLTDLCSFTGSTGSYADLTMDASGNLYGTTYMDGASDSGSVFKVSHSSGGWTCTSLHDFTGGSDGGLPVSSVSIDGQGNLFGTASSGGAYGQGVIWEITP